jgi:DNA polymerase elongation subunit (family B)
MEFMRKLDALGVDGKICGPYKGCYHRYISGSLTGKSHHLIYDDLTKRLNIEQLSTLSYKQFMSFLSGLLDGDGCRGDHSMSWCNYDGDIETLNELCNWNGIFCTVSKNLLRFVDINTSDLKLLKNSRWGDGTISKLDRTSKQKSRQVRFKRIEDTYWVKVKSVEYIGTSTRMMDIQTDTNYFVTKGVRTHNCDGFDNPYLYARLKREMGYKGAKRLSPIGVAYISKWNNSMVIAGVNCLDYMEMFKLFPGKKEPSYTLDYIGKKYAGFGKIAYKGNLNDLYRNDINKFIDYNFNDVQIVVELENKKKYIDIARSLCHAGHVPYEYFDTSSKYIEGAILSYLRRGTGEIVKNKPSSGREEYEKQQEDNEEGFSGAYVKKPIPGKYDWIFDLDLTSMYPSIIISLNISPETKVGIISKVILKREFIEERKKQLMREFEELDGEEDIHVDDYVAREIGKFNMDLHVHGYYDAYVLGSTTYSAEEFSKLVTDSKYSLSSNGVLYRTDKVGVIPSILIDWFNQRKEYRKKAKKAFAKGDMADYAYWDQRQYTVKILLNSVYGVLGLPVFRFYDKDNAEAVTTTGVTIIKTGGLAVNEFFKAELGVDRDYICYSDTDSLFSSALPIIEKRHPNIDKSDMVAMSNATLEITGEVQTFVNKFFDLMAFRFFNLEKHRFEVKQELISKTSFWLAKKRYAQLIINKEGKMLEHPELEVKGIDVVRTSFPAKFRTFMESFLLDLLKGEKKQPEIDKSILDFKKAMKGFAPEDLAKNTSVKFISRNGKNDYNPPTRKPFHYEKGTPAQVKAALNYNDMLTHFGLDKMVEKIHNGSKLKWVYLKQNKFGIDCIAMKADGTDPDEIMSFINQYIDRTALYDHELRDKLSAFYDVQHWHYPTESSALASQFFDF